MLEHRAGPLNEPLDTEGIRTMNNVTPAPVCQPWCADHTADPDGDWCTSAPSYFDTTALELSTGTIDGAPAVFGLGDIGDNPITVEGARQLAAVLTQLADAAELLPTSPQAGVKVQCSRPGCSAYNAGRSHAVCEDGTVVHYQCWQDHSERDATGELVLRWRVGTIARDDEPWQVALDVAGAVTRLDHDQAERLAEGLTRSLVHGLRLDAQPLVLAREADGS